MAVELSELLVQDPNREHGRPCIAGTAIRVHRVAIWDRSGWTPDEMVRRYPHLSLAGIYAALAFYYANKKQIDAEIDADDAFADAFEQQYRRERMDTVA